MNSNFSGQQRDRKTPTGFVGRSAPNGSPWSVEDLKIKVGDLSIARTVDEHRIHCDALEWGLAEPIIINSEQDIKSSVNWRDRVKPFRHQVENLMRFCRRVPVTLLADDVGLGKTISAGLILSELISRGQVARTFVVCPKILIPQWVEELGAKFGIEAYGGAGSDVLAFHERKEPVLVTTYQSATKVLDQQKPNVFDMLILDEAHKVRNLFGTEKPPQMATAVYNALRARMFRYVLMLTATPIQNRLWDIYSLIECLAVAKGHRNPLGNPVEFAAKYLADGKIKARVLRTESAAEFRGIVGNYMSRTRRADAQLAFPEREVRTYEVKTTKVEDRLQSLVAQNIGLLNELLQVSVLVALMSSPHALLAQLRNMAQSQPRFGALADAVGEQVAAGNRPAKITAVLQIVQLAKQQQKHWRIVIFTTRRETQDMIGRVLAQEGIAVGYIRGGESEKNRRAIRDFCEHVPRINVVISTDAGAEGVNLQAANVLINYDLPWNPMIVEQRIGRVQRIGSNFKSVWVANVVHANSPEQRIVARLIEKLQVIAHTVGDIEAVLEAADDPNGESFEQQILRMVVESLKGQDTERATQKYEKSIEDARVLLEERQAEMDSQLGPMQDQNTDDVPMPRLSPKNPATPLRDFVMNALQAEGARVTEGTDGLFKAVYGPRREETFTFERAVAEEMPEVGAFHGRRPLLYQPGKPAFERLVQRWFDKAAAWVVDNRLPAGIMRKHADAWLAKVDGAKLKGHDAVANDQCFSGEVVVRARVANAIDTYEKLIRVQMANFSGIEIPVGGSPDPRKLINGIEEELLDAVSRDSDLLAFRRYYAKRLRIETGKSDAGERLQKLLNDLSPRLFSEVVALNGTLTGGCRIVVRYSLGGPEVWSAELHLDSHGQLVQPECRKCELTGRNVPIVMLGRCCLTGQEVLQDQLAVSDLSGAAALKSLMERCEQTQRLLLPEEVATCSLTGRRVCKDQLAISQISGRLGLKTQSVKCDFTRLRILEDEAAVSDYSGKTHCLRDAVQGPPRYRTVHSSEVCRCEETGDLILADRAATCEITGKTVHKTAVAICEESFTTALKRLMERCEESDALVLSHLLVKCEITNRKVRRSLTAVSAVSGRCALKHLLVRCQMTDELILREEAGQCQITRQTVNRKLLRRCAGSGVVAIRQRLGKSVISGKWFQRQFLVKLLTGGLAARDEVKKCHWNGGYLNSSSVATCQLSGLTFSSVLLNEAGEFGVLRDALDGSRIGEPFSDPDFLLDSKPDVFRGVCDVRLIQGPAAGILHGRRTRFSLFHQYFGVVVQSGSRGTTLRGRAMFGKRSSGVWHAGDQFEM
jgi:superfamily II DNA or RNA helicase